jgi:hypothetical protein
MIHRVFLSSTFSDLQDYRQTVQGAIRQLGAIDVSMEHFGARARSRLTFVTSNASPIGGSRLVRRICGRDDVEPGR